MLLPDELLIAIQQEVEKMDRVALARASAGLTRQYKAGDFSLPALKSEAHRAAYLAARLPATFAASWHVFTEIRRLAPQTEITSLLDLGTGPGTALWAAAAVFPALQQATLLDSDQAWINLGKSMIQHSPHPVLRQAQWLRHDLRATFEWSAYDLVAIAYALGELPPPAAEELVRRAWISAQRFLVIIEPGTMRGFAAINTARSALIASGARILAPCPHSDSCPLAAAGDWCHFSQRVERTSLHRQLKAGSLGYEDEKFSYVAASRQTVPEVGARIVRHPQKHSGHVQLTLCTRHGIESRTITRSQKQDYKLARHADWGGMWKE